MVDCMMKCHTICKYRKAGRIIVRKKTVTVLLALTLAATMPGGCGEPQETGGRAESTEQTGESEDTKESEDTRESETSQEIENETDDAENGESESQEVLGGGEAETDKPELVRPENVELYTWAEYEYDQSGNMTKDTVYL